MFAAGAICSGRLAQSDGGETVSLTWLCQKPGLSTLPGLSLSISARRPAKTRLTAQHLVVNGCSRWFLVNKRWILVGKIANFYKNLKIEYGKCCQVTAPLPEILASRYRNFLPGPGPHFGRWPLRKSTDQGPRLL